MTDVLAEVRAARDALCARFDYDLTALVRYLQERERLAGRELLPPPPKQADTHPTRPNAGRDAA